MLDQFEVMNRTLTANDDFEELMVQYWPLVFAHAYRIMGNQQDAEDQAQEVFLKVHRSIDSLKNPLALRSWITKITRNTCRDALDHKKRRPQTVSLAPSNQHSAYHSPPQFHLPTPEQAAVRAEEYRTIMCILEQIDPRARQTLVLRDVEGRSYQEIGQMLQLGPSAVKMRIRRARQLFGRMLVDTDPELWRV